MDIIKIKLTNFRNFSRETEVQLPQAGLLVAAAPNAAGKTNFLEGVVMLLRGKTWRARAEECVKWGEDSFLLEGEIERQEGDDSLVAVRYHRPSKKIRIEEDGVPASVVSFYAHYPFVLFVPEDTFLLSRGPAQRRNFINNILVSHRGYVSALVQYHRVLKQRNLALKQARHLSDVSAWTELLTEHANVVWRHRESLVSFWNEEVSDMYRKLSGERRDFDIQMSFGAKNKNSFIGELEKSFDFEKRYGYTAYGPHRDDVVILTEGKIAATVLSQGQQKSLVVAMKVVSHRYVKKLVKEEPLLLLDDVLAELDEDRQVTLMENLPETQTILTCTSLPKTLKGRANVYSLDLRSIIQDGNSKRVAGKSQPRETKWSQGEVEESVEVKKDGILNTEEKAVVG